MGQGSETGEVDYGALTTCGLLPLGREEVHLDETRCYASRSAAVVHGQRQLTACRRQLEERGVTGRRANRRSRGGPWRKVRGCIGVERQRLALCTESCWCD